MSCFTPRSADSPVRIPHRRDRHEFVVLGCGSLRRLMISPPTPRPPEWSATDQRRSPGRERRAHQVARVPAERLVQGVAVRTEKAWLAHWIRPAQSVMTMALAAAARAAPCNRSLSSACRRAVCPSRCHDSGSPGRWRPAAGGPEPAATAAGRRARSPPFELEFTLRRGRRPAPLVPHADYRRGAASAASLRRKAECCGAPARKSARFLGPDISWVRSSTARRRARAGILGQTQRLFRSR